MKAFILISENATKVEQISQEKAIEKYFESISKEYNMDAKLAKTWKYANETISESIPGTVYQLSETEMLAVVEISI